MSSDQVWPHIGRYYARSSNERWTDRIGARLCSPTGNEPTVIHLGVFLPRDGVTYIDVRNAPPSDD